jgi:hypothetical protein
VKSNARDSAIVPSFGLQQGADIESIRKALCRDSHGRAPGPLDARSISWLDWSASEIEVSPAEHGWA